MEPTRHLGEAESIPTVTGSLESIGTINTDAPVRFICTIEIARCLSVEQAIMNKILLSNFSV